MPRLLLQCLLLTMTALLAAGCADYGPRKKSAPAVVQPPAYSEKKTPVKKTALPQEKKAPAAAEKKDPTEFDVDGFGKTEEDSKKYAVLKAAEKVKTRLDPPLQWTPPEDFVLKKLLTGASKRRPDQDSEIDGQMVLCWTWTVRLPPAEVEFMRREDAKFRTELAARERSVLAEARMRDLLKVVAVLVLGQAGVWLLVRAFRSPGGG